MLQCRGNFNASGCPEVGLCCLASRPHCCAIFLYLDAYAPVLGKNQTRLQTHFRQRPFAKYCILQRYSKLYGKKKDTICKYSACIHLQTKNLMLILRDNWRIYLFSWEIAIRSGLVSALPATDGSPLASKRKVIFCHYFLI